MAETILIPLLNTNEPEALLAAIAASEGQTVQAGETLFTLETTKSTAEVSAPSTGYLRGIRFRVGQTVQAGDVFGYLTKTIDEKIPEEELTKNTLVAQNQTMILAEGQEPPAGLRITQPGLALARQLRIDLTLLPQGKYLTEGDIHAFANLGSVSLEIHAPAQAFDPTALIIYGGGGHGKALLELVRALGVYRIAGIIDDGLPAGGTILGLEVLGGSEKLPELYQRGIRLAVNAVGGIGDVRVRERVFQRLAQAGFISPAVVHPSAVVEPSANLSAGVQVFPLAYVGSEARLGFGCIINTGAIVSHDCQLGDLVNISPGAMLAGEVEIGAGALVGMGATINLRVKIGPGTRIGNGATVKSDVPAGGVVRAGGSWPS
jgi:sugar O-acyltransferase (sialic acid O-acetyltransferase NeuD family)